MKTTKPELHQPLTQNVNVIVSPEGERCVCVFVYVRWKVFWASELDRQDASMSPNGWSDRPPEQPRQA